MLIMLFLLTLQWTLVATALCAAWRRGDAFQAAVAARAVAVIPPLTLASIAALLFADRLLIWPERLLMLALAVLTGLLWSFGFLRVDEAPGRAGRLMHSPSRTGARWLALSMLLQGALTLTATWIVLNGFLMKSPFMVGVWRWLWLTLLGALAAGALLVAVTLAGLLAGRRVSADAPDDASPRFRDPIPRLSLVMIGLVLLRGLVLAGSVALWAHSCPFGPRYLIERMLVDGYHLIPLRVLLGLVLPTLFGGLALLAWRDGVRQQAAFQFFPAFLVVLISEMAAFALTVGLGGVVF